MAKRAIEVSAPGKINLILRVLDRRPDHYHNIYSVMQTVELADTIVIEEDTNSSDIHLSCEGADLPPGPQNLAYRAASAALTRMGRMGGVRIHIRKRLPVSAGMGGGSSDAASTICAVAALFNMQWSREEMADIAQDIGSDVPFFYYGPLAVVEGRGDRVTSLRSSGEGWVVLVNPNIAIATAWAYGQLAEVRRQSGGSILDRPPPRFSASDSLDWKQLLSCAENDFGPVLEDMYPVLREIRLRLLECGAQAALLSGSGSTVFGVFPTEASAQAAVSAVTRRDWRVWITRTCRRQESPRSLN